MHSPTSVDSARIMKTELSDIDSRLAEFDRRYSPPGLLIRYATGRVKHFLSRQILTLSGALTLVALVSPAVGALAVTLALLGEILDCLFLRTVPARLEKDPGQLRRLQVLTTCSAVFQGATIACCVAIGWLTAPGDAGMFFSLAYATGASINAGIVLPFHKGAALGRLAVYGLTVCALFVTEVWHEGDHPMDLSYNVLGGLMMAYMVVVFISYVVSGHRREYRNSRNLLHQGRELALTNLSLEEQQREARNLSWVAKGAHDSVIMSTPEGEIIWTNETFTRTTGYSAAEARGKRPADLLNGPETSEETSQAIARAVQEQRSYRAEILNYTKDGRKIWIETHLAPVFDDDGKMEMVIAIERDITASKTHEMELAKAKQAAEQGEKTKSRFLATMSHEIRTPMNGIMGMADLLAEEGLSHESRLCVDTIRDSAETLLTIINDILDFSKLDAGHMQLSPVPFRLVDCIQGVLNLLTPQAATKGLYLRFQGADTLPDTVLGDDTRLRQILMNVIGNAIKFTEEGGICVVAECATTGDGYALTIDVIDTGIGIPPERVGQVFKQFSQAEADTTRRFGGTGLGLAISLSLARIMGGGIEVTSELNKGSRFRITVALESTSETILPNQQTIDVTSNIDLDGITVLLAEDNRTNRLLIEKYTKNHNMTLLMAQNGAEAVDLTRTHRPDIVLMDMAMPVMDGLEASRQIRALDLPQPHIVALTANAYASDRAACREAGMDGFLSKPVRKQKLLQELAAFCGQPRDPAQSHWTPG